MTVIDDALFQCQWESGCTKIVDIPSRIYCAMHYHWNQRGLTQSPLTKPALSQEDSQLLEIYGHLVSRHVGRHGLTPIQYVKMLVEQDFRCASCMEIPVKFHIDHDHKCCPKWSCGKCVRGLLCPRCNGAAGYYDNDELMSKVAKYIERKRNNDLSGESR